MRRIAEKHGPRAIAITLSSPSTTAIANSSGFIQPLVNAFGTPNAAFTLDVCGWGRAFATRYTFGIGSVGTGGRPMPDIANSGVLIVPPPGEARPDTDVIFDLAARLGFAEQFWNGDIDDAYRHQLAPIGIGLEELRA